MIREAIEKIISLKKPEQITIEGKPYRADGYKPVLDMFPEPLHLNTLDGVIAFVKENSEKWEDLFIQVSDYNRVTLYKGMSGDFNQRIEVLNAGSRACGFKFGREYPLEEFIIALHSQFIRSDDRDYLLKFVSSIRFDENSEIKDNGVSQRITVRQGTSSLVSDIDIKPIVYLMPFRTFNEIKQPLSMFVFRMKVNGKVPSCALYECDGEGWKDSAISSIAEYLEEGLASLVMRMPIIA